IPGTTPPTNQLDWLSSTTAMIVLSWSRATRDLLRSFGWGIAALHRENAATKLPFPRRPPHSVYRSPLDASEPPTQLGLRSGGGSAYTSSMRSLLNMPGTQRNRFAVEKEAIQYFLWT